MTPRQARRFVIVRHDNLGDVALALPMAGLLKRALPDCHVAFAIRAYARDVVLASRHVDAALVFDSPASFEQVLRTHRADAVVFAFPDRALARAAAAAGVPIRVGTARRWWHWRWATHRPWVRRRDSDRHEAQLNLALLAPFVDEVDLPRDALWPLAGLAPDGAPRDAPRDAPAWPLKAGVANLLLQIRSNGNGKEWPLDHYVALVRRLSPARVNAIVNGTPAEGDALRAAAPELFALPQVTDATRGFPVAALMRALPRMDAVLSNSTGPMHLAALSGAPTLGLFVDLPGMDPTRWGPLGPQAHALLAPRAACVRCPRGAPRCPCLAALGVDTVLRALPPAVADGA